MNKALTITEKAKARLLEQLSNSNKQGISLRVKGSGCSGNTYSMDFIDRSSINKFDEIIELDGTHFFVVEAKSIMSVIGTEMDWVGDTFNQKYEFRNPNVIPDSYCGCGTSFKVKEQEK